MAAENEEETDEERDTDMPGDQVHPTGASHLGLLVLERYEHVGCERHDLPGDEQDHGPRASRTSTIDANITLKKNAGGPAARRVQYGRM